MWTDAAPAPATLILFFLPLAATAESVEDCLREAAEAEVALEESVLSLVKGDPQRDLAAMQGEIARLEAAGGWLDPPLLPHLIGLGLALSEAERHGDAASAFHRAVFITRANDGLYSTRQIPVVNLLIESRAAAGDWKGVADAYDLLAWVYRRSHAPLDPAQLPALRKLRRWYIGAYDKDTGRTLTELFAANERVTGQAVDILLHCGGDEREALCFLEEACCPGTAVSAASCPTTVAPALNLPASRKSNGSGIDGG